MEYPEKSTARVKRYKMAQKAMGRKRIEFIVTEPEKHVLRATLKQLREQPEQERR